MPTVSPSPDPVRAWLAALLRDEDPGPMPDEAVLLDTARAEGVLALCHDRLRRSPAWEQYPETLRAALTRHAYQEVAVEMMRAAELREVLEALAQQGLPVLLLKGAALAYTLYPEPHLRTAATPICCCLPGTRPSAPGGCSRLWATSGRMRWPAI